MRYEWLQKTDQVTKIRSGGRWEAVLSFCIFARLSRMTTARPLQYHEITPKLTKIRASAEYRALESTGQQIVYLSKMEGASRQALSRTFDVSSSKVQRTLKANGKLGPRGRPPVLNPQELERLKEVLTIAENMRKPLNSQEVRDEVI